MVNQHTMVNGGVQPFSNWQWGIHLNPPLSHRKVLCYGVNVHRSGSTGLSMAQQFRCSQWPKLSAAQPQRTNAPNFLVSGSAFAVLLGAILRLRQLCFLASQNGHRFAMAKPFINVRVRSKKKQRTGKAKPSFLFQIGHELHFFPELRCSKLFLSPLRALKTSGMFNPSPVDRSNKTQPRPCAEHCNTHLDAVGPGADVEPGVAGQ